MLKIILAVKEFNEEISSLLHDHELKFMQSDGHMDLIKGKEQYDLVILRGDVESVSEIKEADPRIEVILFGDDDISTLKAIQNGASAYFPMILNPSKLLETVENIDGLMKERRETGDLEKKLASKYTFEGVVAKNPKMLDIINLIRRIAPYSKAVLITGETGTGKEIIANTLHKLSPASKHPFVTCNCGALVETLIESELFGHKKGAFTGAINDKKGLFESAGEGTVFLDEIGELPMSFQPHFLRVLQNGEYRPVGSDIKKKARCKVIAASNIDIVDAIKNHRFREDLFYRIAPFIIHVPPLRQRKDDIQLLCRLFLSKFVNESRKKVYGISRPAQKALLAYDWPGNVRELENVIEHAAILTEDTFIRLEDLPTELRQLGSIELPEPMTLESVQNNHIRSVLTRCSGNKTEAAQVLGISRWALLRKLEKLNIN